jgi:ABC-type multidrug transport system fused ATPase/permease subunit
MSRERFHFDEFKMFYESTEKVIDRKYLINKWNYTVSIAILIAITVIFNWSITSHTFILPALIIIVILSIMAIIYSYVWIQQIKDLKQLNNAKFKVLNEMAEHISFGEDSKDTRISHRPFEKEWELLQNMQATVKSTQSNLTILKGSKSEYIVPKSFITLFSVIIIMIVLFSILNTNKIFNIENLELPSTEQVKNENKKN